MKVPGLYDAVVADTIANVVTVFALGLGAYILSLLTELRRRRAFVRVLRGTSRLPEIRVFFSSLSVKLGGTELSSSIRGGYAGQAIVKIEYDAARVIREQLRTNWLGYVWLAVHTILRGGRPNFSISRTGCRPKSPPH